MLLLEDIKIEIESQGLVSNYLRFSPDQDRCVLMMESHQETSKVKCPVCGGNVHIYDKSSSHIKDMPLIFILSLQKSASTTPPAVLCSVPFPQTQYTTILN